jgi:hypothetical protein
MNLKKTFLVALGAGALAAPAAALAHPGGDHGHGHGHGGNQTVTYVFKGTYGGDGVVNVNHGNGHVKKADLVGSPVQFDLADARLVVADTNADGAVTADDVKVDDRVVVQARLPKQSPGAQPFAAQRLIDQDSAPDDGGDED